ncbi:hypothetical protein DVR12_14775 [Chitinophaga silvatica]|uniref:SHOCT domain-containing protein n=1 Tax=Chitinophaga silvatica TaxID=2282649 RepID=A0A3E1Y938_9BACT|nr:SHOCT domain-containing protein [Chitinophaga silvatica]RFS21913.1 hypothetical protein DVR12_14775 [Chitinophaga silvatica]
MNIKNIKPTFFLSLFLIASFFLPWFIFPGAPSYTSGWTLPVRIGNGGWVASSVVKDLNLIWFKVLYLVYLVPIFAAYNIFLRLTRKKPAINEYFIGLLGTILIFVMIRLIEMKFSNAMVNLTNQEYDLKLYTMLSVGFFACIFICIVGMYFTLVREVDDYMSFDEEMEQEYPTAYGSANPAASVKGVPIANGPNRTEVYSRLEQLHGLYEKGILGKEQYEQEKQELLQLLPKSNQQQDTAPGMTKASEPLVEYNNGIPSIPVEHSAYIPMPEEAKSNKNSILTILLLVLAGAGIGSYFMFFKSPAHAGIKPISDLTNDDLKGNVSAYSIYSYNVYLSDGGEPIKGDVQDSETFPALMQFEADKDGFYTLCEKGYANRTYDESNNLMVTQWFKDKEKKQLQYTYYSRYNKKGRPEKDSIVLGNSKSIVRKSEYTADGLSCSMTETNGGILNGKAEFRYNEKGQLIWMKSNNEETSYEYNSNDEVSTKKYWVLDAEEDGLTEYVFQYKYDKTGNWISRIVYVDKIPSAYQERKIIYREQ